MPHKFNADRRAKIPKQKRRVTNATDAGDDLKDAITLLRDQNSTGKRKLPDDPPMPFAAKHWPALIVQDGKPQR